MPLASATARNQIPVRLAIALCAVALVAATLLVSATPAAGQDLGSRIAAVRAAQRSAESAMREQDSVILSISVQRQAAARQIKPLEKTLKRANADLNAAQAVVQERKTRLAEKESAWQGAAEGTPRPDDWYARLNDIRRDLRLAEARRSNIGTRMRAAQRTLKAKRSQLASLKRQRKAAVSRREGAEASLSANIAQMTSLARSKVAEQAMVSLEDGGTYSWPTTGRIVQTYGCTGFKLNPRKGSCKHFHDGIDVVDAYGTPVRSVAAGVVAYSGWNPYDQEGRAYVVDIVHADGFVSRYGHLIPTDRVKAGELVYTGQTIGKMGNTGKSTGTHLHFEVLRNGQDVNPLDYLPAGQVQIDKASTKAGQAELERAARQAAKPDSTPKPEKVWQPPAKAFDYAEKRPVATCAPAAAEGGKKKSGKGKQAISGPQAGAVECEPTGLFAAGVADAPPVIPKPYRGADPAPA